ncbi:MAG: mechanosensitive ion channel [Desulfovibrio sp.]|jgi:small-conductance mechanosensitive channel|nr:mechanosensitive ion channel [Desulfovibrio sp.]
MPPLSSFIRPEAHGKAGLGAGGFFAAFVLCLLFSVPAGAAAPGPDAPGDGGLSRMWSVRAGDLAALTDEAENLRKRAEELGKTLEADLRNTRLRFSRLSGLFQASRGHPAEQLALARQMHSLREALRDDIAPMEEIASAVRQRLDEVAGLQKDMGGVAQDSATGSAARDSDREAYTRALSAASRKFALLAERLDILLSPAKTLLGRIERSIEDIEGSLVDIWQNYYLSPAGPGVSAPVPAMLADWLSSVPSRLSFAYPQSAEEWQDAGKTFLFHVLIMAVLGFIGSRGVFILPLQWRGVWLRSLVRALVCMGLGLGVLAAAANQYGVLYYGFALLGGLLLVAGTASLTWRLRVTVRPDLTSASSPLMRLLPPAFFGVFLLFSDPPARVLSILWATAMSVFLAYAFFSRKSGGKLPLLEAFARICSVWFGLASLLAAGLGYARLGVLLFILLFTLINCLSLGSSLMRIFAVLAGRVFDAQDRPIGNAVAQAASVPFAWVLSLLCAGPWFWVAPGAGHMLRQLLGTSYTVGEASFDFSRLLLIVLLFFLFRSFIRLGRASLEHLPTRLPNIEPGVIPPLGTMLRYGFWTLFAVVSLSLLGVDFTSLAVVAGGLSVGIGFGMQNLFNNLVSGLMLIFGRTILVGDYVEVAGATGTVRAINIRSTTIETAERAMVFVPNSAIMAGQFTNWTRNNRMVRRTVTVGVAYGSDTALVEKLLLAAAGAQTHVLSFPSPVVLFSDFGANSLDFALHVFIDDLDNAAPTLSALRFSIERLFAENGIDIPFPQLTLHMPGRQTLPAAPR